MPELIWEEKYDVAGKRVAPPKVVLPFQTVETVNESAQERQRSLFFAEPEQTEWRNRLIWGDKKYVLPVLAGELSGQVDLIYIDPPFATGSDFSFMTSVPGGSETFTKEPSVIEQKAYRDTWGRGLDGYLSWFYDSVSELADLLSESGSIYVHLDWHVASYARTILDEVFGTDSFQNEITWRRTTAHSDSKTWSHVTDVIDNVVKRPMKGITAGLDEGRSDVASVKYQGYITAGVERWREYREQLKPLGKKPILFVMLNSAAEADDVGDYLRVKYPAEFGANDSGEAQLLVIHTDRSGDVSKKDLDAARDVARKVDEGDSPVNAIVSVLMLREGWDVQNVTVIVGLRPYTAKANILPEQTIGRGLRLMFGTSQSSYVERVDVIGNPAFLKFVEQLEKDEDITLDTFDLKEPVVITTIAPDPEKMAHDITVPVLSPILARKKTLAEEIASIDVTKLACPKLPKKEGDAAASQFHFEGCDIMALPVSVGTG